MTAPRSPSADRADPPRFALALLPILAAALALTLLGSFADHEAALASLFLLAGASWLWAIRIARRGGGDLRVVVAGAIALRCLAWAGTPTLSADVYRYAWEGTVLLDGASPYAFAPGDLELSDLRARHPDMFARVEHRDVPAAYPPLTQLAGAVGVRLAPVFGAGEAEGAARALRNLFGLCDLLVLWPLAALLAARGLPRTLCVAWAWSPLAAVEFAGSGHFDSLGIVLLVTALAVPRFAIAAAAVSAGALVKWLPLVALPWIARGRGARVAFIGAAVVAGACALAFAPFLWLRGGERGFLAGIAEYGNRWESGSVLYRWIEAPLLTLFARDESWTDPRRLGRCLAAIAWLACAARAWARERDPARGTAACLGAFLVLSPTLHPWYLTWMIPFLALRPTAAWSWLLAAAPLLYAPLVVWQREGRWVEPTWLWPVVALPFLVLLARESFLGTRTRTS